VSVQVQATVVSVQVDPLMRHRLARHLVRVRVDKVIEGAAALSELGSDQLTLLVHSPSKTFGDPDPVGQEYLLTLDDPLSEPYVGSLVVESAG
jgi:hypothetical protein